MKPTVSFVVPCYKLAHLLPQCLDTVLAQTYADFEVLVMDDCSPDHAPDVVRSYQDKRIIHVRNETNLGHLRNYNEGIRRSQGKYVWLISADDYLRRPYALERYVSLLERHPAVGYAFCPAVRATKTDESELLTYSQHGSRDKVFKGTKFLKKLIFGNKIVAASGIVRRECYEKISVFPLDMPWAGDWYLWCVFALHNDVGYIAEPMVCYRTHQQSMTSTLMRGGLQTCAADDIRVPWTIGHMAAKLGLVGVAKSCLKAAANEYARSCSSYRYRTSCKTMTMEEFEASLTRNTSLEKEKRFIRARVMLALADQHYWAGDVRCAREFYMKSLKNDAARLTAWAKWLVSLSGPPGAWARANLKAIRQHVS